MEGFTAFQACRLAGVTQNQLRYWDKVALVNPSVQVTGGRPGVRRLYSFRDLIELKIVKSLMDGGMSLQRVRRAFMYLRENLALEEHLSSVRLVTDGSSIFKVCKDEGEVLDALKHGQLTFCLAIDKIAQKVDGDVAEFRRDREAFMRTLRTVETELEAETGVRPAKRRKAR